MEAQTSEGQVDPEVQTLALVGWGEMVFLLECRSSFCNGRQLAPVSRSAAGGARRRGRRGA